MLCRNVMKMIHNLNREYLVTEDMLFQQDGGTFNLAIKQLNYSRKNLMVIS